MSVASPLFPRAFGSSPTPRRICGRPRSASSSAPARATRRTQEHGLSHLLEHMAFKGTRRRNAREIAEAIENAGGDLNAETGVEQTAYFARVLGEDVDLALDVLADILTESQFDAGRTRPREERHPPGDRRGRGHARRSRFRLLHRRRLARTADRTADPRHARRRQRLRSRRDRRLSAPPLPRRRHGRRRGRRGRSRPKSSRRPSSSSRPLGGESRRSAQAGRLSRRRNPGQEGARADPYRRRLRGARDPGGGP